MEMRRALHSVGPAASTSPQTTVRNRTALTRSAARRARRRSCSSVRIRSQPLLSKIVPSPFQALHPGHKRPPCSVRPTRGEQRHARLQRLLPRVRPDGRWQDVYNARRPRHGRRRQRQRRARPHAARLPGHLSRHRGARGRGAGRAAAVHLQVQLPADLQRARVRPPLPWPPDAHAALRRQGGRLRREPHRARRR